MAKKKSYAIWGKDLDPQAIKQMENAMELPIAVQGALMPDAHKGYGLPIGGVLAVDNAVIPYAVGVDIACRVRLSVLPIPFSQYKTIRGDLKKALDTQTRFGVGARFKRPKNHSIMDEDWEFCPRVKALKDKAWQQLGTSGSGNHFAEFGKLILDKDLDNNLDKSKPGLKKGTYIALLTHSGSRGTGAAIAKHYSAMAKGQHPELASHLQNLAWLSMDHELGVTYFKAMELMGGYAAANHEIIHEAVFRTLGESPIMTIENHHNFAWREKIGSRKVLVHRKGAIPAGKGKMGIIPGTLADPGFVIKGLGNQEAINSAAHGAGRAMSRTAAKKLFTFKDLQGILQKRQITLISAGLDEIPMAYKNIHHVMAQQKGLVETIAMFEPKLVKMAPTKRSKKKFQ